MVNSISVFAVVNFVCYIFINVVHNCKMSLNRIWNDLKGTARRRG